MEQQRCQNGQFAKFILRKNLYLATRISRYAPGHIEGRRLCCGNVGLIIIIIIIISL